MVALKRFGSPPLFLSGGHLPAATPQGMLETDGAAPGFGLIPYVKRSLQDLCAQTNMRGP